MILIYILIGIILIAHGDPRYLLRLVLPSEEEATLRLNTEIKQERKEAEGTKNLTQLQLSRN